MSLSHGPKIVSDGLILHLDAASVKSYPATGSTWFDLSGNGNNGVITGSVPYSTLFAGVLNTPGTTGNYINISSINLTAGKGSTFIPLAAINLFISGMRFL